jgi:hypothetical protein
VIPVEVDPDVLAPAQRLDLADAKPCLACQAHRGVPVLPRGSRRVQDPELGSLLHQYQLYFNESRPHQGIGQRVPTKLVLDIDLSKPIEVTSVLGGLHVDYRRAA